MTLQETSASTIPTEMTAVEADVLRKVTRRLVPFLFVAAVALYLDRINIAYAALTMNQSLHLTATLFGLNVGFFSIGYIISEIPSNMLMARFGARIWLPRIMITWGLATMATVFAYDAVSLLGLRFLLGLAEGGFFPGVFLYLSYWFPDERRGRVTGYFLLAQPVTLLFGAAVSGAILDLDGWAGLAGWRWMFLLEGLPSVILGMTAFFVLTSKPAQARWLTETEKAALQRMTSPGNVGAPTTLMATILSRRVLLLGAAYFGMPVSLNAFVTWSPQIVRAMLASHSLSVVGLIGAIPALATIVVMPLWSRSSDRSGERVWHTVLALVFAVFGWLLVMLASAPEIRLVGLSIACAGVFAAQSVFFPLVTSSLPPNMRPVGLAAVNVVGIVGAALSPIVIGVIKDATGRFDFGLAFVVAALALSTGVIAFQKRV